MKLEEIRPKALIEGIEPGKVVTIRYVEKSSPDVYEVAYKLDDGTLKERQLFRSDEEKLSPAAAGRHFTFTADAELFKLVLEAYRISNAHLFDPYAAVHSSNITPLPHQITAVYEAMLPKQPLRFVLADDPGAGKTIMAGLLMRELIARSDTERILIVSPGVLVEQWQDELAEKFGLKFTILSHELSEECRGNVFEENNFLIARIDQLKRNEEYLAMLEAFTTGDPDGNGVNGDTCGVSAAGYIAPEAPWTMYLPEFYQGATVDFTKDENGQWVDGFTQDNMKATLERMQDAYAKSHQSLATEIPVHAILDIIEHPHYKRTVTGRHQMYPTAGNALVVPQDKDDVKQHHKDGEEAEKDIDRLCQKPPKTG